MARGPVLLPQGMSISDDVTLGVLIRSVPATIIDQVLDETGRRSVRERALPARFMVYFVMAMTLFFQDSYLEVQRKLFAALRWLSLADWIEVGAGKSAITTARRRLGREPLQRLFERVARPLAGERTRGAWYRGRRLVAWDGTMVDLADEPEIEAAFGRPDGGAPGGCPQMRLFALVETGTRVVFGLAGGPLAAGETELARRLLGQLKPGMLCLADRGLVGGRLWRDAAATGADLLWRVRSNQKFACLRRLPDGSFLSRMNVDSTDPGAGTVPVRVIEYTLKGIPGAEPVYRLVTTILDPEAAPAAELAALYHERWEAETTLGEIKVRLPGRRLMLRSRSVELVWQELYGLALTHFALRELMHEAALAGDRDVDELSFTHTVKVVQSHVVMHGSFPPCAPSGNPDEDHPRDLELPG
jgi:Insertion element 4 transposase N-terminal/Transposase DDE domain